MTDHADLTARLRAKRPCCPDGPSMAFMHEAADALDAADAENARLTAERDEALARLLRLADWVQQYEMERDAARLSSASADLSLLASIRQSMFDEAEAVLAVSEEATDA